MRPLRRPTLVPIWLGPLLVAVGFGVFVVLAHADRAGLGLAVLAVCLVVWSALVVAEPFVTRNRSRELRARLAPADVAARVDLDALVRVLTSGRPKAHLAGARVVQQAFPRLTPVDAIEVTRATVPGLLPPRRAPERPRGG